MSSVALHGLPAGATESDVVVVGWGWGEAGQVKSHCSHLRKEGSTCQQLISVSQIPREMQLFTRAFLILFMQASEARGNEWPMHTELH